MRRSGALTLGAVLMLGGVTGGRGDELSGSVGADDSVSPGGFSLPALPENWSDLPVRLTASESLSYNSNINAVPLGSALPSGFARGDFTSTSDYGFSTKANVFGQQLYFDGSLGVIRYLHQVAFDSNVYSLSAGDNWTLTSRCAGTLGVSLSKSPALITELVGAGVNYTTTTSLNETGKCAISNGYSLLFNSGLTTDTNSNPIDAVNNDRTTMLSAGIEYAKGPSTLTALANNSNSSFTGRTAAEAGFGLATATDFHTFTLNYTRQISANLSVTGQTGLVGVTSGFNLGLPKTLLPIYTLSTMWTITPKLALTASASRTIAPPLTVIANAQISYNATMNLTYAVTPKVAFNVGGSVAYTSAVFTPGLTGTGTGFSPVFFGAQDIYTATAGLTYAMTPFLSAALTASFNEVAGSGFITPQDIVTVSLSYKPY